MRKYLISLVGAFLFLAVLVVSCSQGDDEFDIYACTDNSLAGSVWLNSEMKDFEFWYDDELIVSVDPKDDVWLFEALSTTKLTDTTMRATIAFDRRGLVGADSLKLVIGIPNIELKGEPYDVTFDCVSNDCYVRHADWETYTAQLHVCGWIKNITRYPNLCDQEGESAVIISDLYTIDMTISGEIDGEEIVFKLDSIK